MRDDAAARPAERAVERGCRFCEFYPYYQREHSEPAPRVPHVVGTVGLLGFVAAAVVLGWPWLLVGVVCAYALAWTGHFVFARNRPATFRFPLFSIAADFLMTAEIVSGRRGLRERA